MCLWSVSTESVAQIGKDAAPGSGRRRSLLGVSKIKAALPRVDPTKLNDTDRMELHVFGTEGKGHVNLVAVLDNLGKGASGAAVQNMELMLAGRA